jgi:hypothetical protein
MYFAPRLGRREKSSTKSDPAFHAVMTSVGVKAPAMINTLFLDCQFDVGRFNPGLTKLRTCIQATTRGVSGVEHGPWPDEHFRTAALAEFTNHFDRSGTVIVISTIGIPPRQTASATINAFASMTTHAPPVMTPISAIRSRTFCLFIIPRPSRFRSSRDARPTPSIT